MNDREQLDGNFYQLFGPVRHSSIKGQAVAGVHGIEMLPVPVNELAFEQVDKFVPGMAEVGKDFAGIVHGDQKRFVSLIWSLAVTQ